jgi:hypothetical protein
VPASEIESGVDGGQERAIVAAVRLELRSLVARMIVTKIRCEGGPNEPLLVEQVHPTGNDPQASAKA